MPKSIKEMKPLDPDAIEFWPISVQEGMEEAIELAVFYDLRMKDGTTQRAYTILGPMHKDTDKDV